jgi:hypothetical protein
MARPGQLAGLPGPGWVRRHARAGGVDAGIKTLTGARLSNNRLAISIENRQIFEFDNPLMIIEITHERSNKRNRK